MINFNMLDLQRLMQQAGLGQQEPTAERTYEPLPPPNYTQVNTPSAPAPTPGQGQGVDDIFNQVSQIQSSFTPTQGQGLFGK